MLEPSAARRWLLSICICTINDPPNRRTVRDVSWLMLADVAPVVDARDVGDQLRREHHSAAARQMLTRRSSLATRQALMSEC